MESDVNDYLEMSELVLGKYEPEIELMLINNENRAKMKMCSVNQVRVIDRVWVIFNWTNLKIIAEMRIKIVEDYAEKIHGKDVLLLKT